jgi:hypothetical protein
VRTLRAEALQWFALFGGALAWAGQLVLVYAVATISCSEGGSQWGIDEHAWTVAVTSAAALVVLLAEASAIAVALDAREAEHDGPPPVSRRYFFAVAAIVGNLLFLGAVVLSGVGIVAHPPCQQS